MDNIIILVLLEFNIILQKVIPLTRPDKVTQLLFIHQQQRKWSRQQNRKGCYPDRRKAPRRTGRTTEGTGTGKGTGTDKASRRTGGTTAGTGKSTGRCPGKAPRRTGGTTAGTGTGKAHVVLEEQLQVQVKLHYVQKEQLGEQNGFHASPICDRPCMP